MARCYICNKGAQHILKVSHSKQRTGKWSKPNLHPVIIKTNKGSKRVMMCTKCLRRYKSDPSILNK